MPSQQCADGECEKLDAWEVLEERLGQPGNPRAGELTAKGWQLVGVLVQTGGFSGQSTSEANQTPAYPVTRSSDTYDTWRVQDIGIVSSHAPTVDRPAGSRYIYLTFEGLRDSRTIADKHTRVRVALPVGEIARLRAELAEPDSDAPTDIVI